MIVRYQMIHKILNTETKSVNFAAFILGVASLISALLGLARDLLLARQFGAGDELDVYYAAFKIPDFIALVLIMGAISAAIIPVFTQYLSRSKEEAWDFLSAFLNICLVVLIIVAASLAIIAPLLISLIAPGFDGEKREVAILLTRIMFLSPIILGVSNVISGVLQVFQRFLVTSLAPIFYNIGIILGILFLVPLMGVSGLAWGVVLGAAIHLIIQLPVFFHAGFKYKPVFNFFHQGVVKVIKLMLPRSLGLAASQINLIVITAIASTLAAGSIAIFTLANNIIAILIGIVAIPLTSAVFPALSLSFFDEDKTVFLKQFSLAFRHIVFLVIPLSFLFFTLKTQIISLLFESAKFGTADVQLTAACLGLFSFGIFAQGLVLLASKTFFATHNTKTPAIISAVVVCLNIALSLFFVSILRSPNFFQENISSLFNLENSKGLEIVGLPMALSISAIFQLFLLLLFLKKIIGSFETKEIFNSFVKTVFASIVMALFVRLSMVYPGFNHSNFYGLFWQTFFSVIVGLLVFVGITYFMKMTELKTLIK